MSLLIERGTVTPMARKYWRSATFGKLPIAEASSGSPSSIFRFHLEVAHFSVTSGAELLVATTASELLPAAGAELLAAPIDVSARAAAVVGVGRRGRFSSGVYWRVQAVQRGHRGAAGGNCRRARCEEC